MILDSTFVFDLMADDRDAFAKGVELVEAGGSSGSRRRSSRRRTTVR